MASVRLFVYGSLKRGGLHHVELGGAPFLGEACTAPGYALVPFGPYLALVERPGGGSVDGELFEVGEALLPLLDEFEGGAYHRAAVPVVFRAESGFALAYLQRTG